MNGKAAGFYRVLGSWEWFEDPGLSIPSEITKITAITDEMVAGHRIDDRAINEVHNAFNLQRHLISRSTLRIFRAEATAQWQDAVAVA